MSGMEIILSFTEQEIGILKAGLAAHRLSLKPYTSGASDTDGAHARAQIAEATALTDRLDSATQGRPRGCLSGPLWSQGAEGMPEPSQAQSEAQRPTCGHPGCSRPAVRVVSWDEPTHQHFHGQTHDCCYNH
jgi:hypothetical protein